MNVVPLSGDPTVLAEADLLPSVDDVALLLRTRTVGYQPGGGGLGADSGSADVGTFTDSTRPTATEVEAVIAQAADELLGLLPASADERYLPAIERAIGLRAAVIIEASFFRETSAAGDLASSYTAALAGLQAALPGGDALVASGLSEREQDVQDALDWRRPLGVV
jgi:hypothetical protein